MILYNKTGMLHLKVWTIQPTVQSLYQLSYPSHPSIMNIKNFSVHLSKQEEDED